MTVENARALLDTVAALHGRYWQSLRFSGDLSWVETHLDGDLASMMNGLATVYIQHEIDNENFKREMVQRLRTTGPEMLAGVQAVQRHQASLPNTLLHGDTHLGNTYMLPDGRAGLLVPTASVAAAQPPTYVASQEPVRVVGTPFIPNTNPRER